MYFAVLEKYCTLIVLLFNIYYPKKNLSVNLILCTTISKYYYYFFLIPK